MINTDYKPMKKLIFYFLKNTSLDYTSLYELLAKDKKLKEEYKIWNNYDLEEYQRLVTACIHELVFTGELDCKMGQIRINRCLCCKHNGQQGSSISMCDVCRNFSEYVPNED